MKHLLRRYEAEVLRLLWSTRYARMMRLLRKHEAKRTTASTCAEGTLHRAKPCIIFHAPQVRFIEKSTCFRKCFFLAPPVGLEPTTPWLTVMCSTDWAKEEYERSEYFSFLRSRYDSACRINTTWAKEDHYKMYFQAPQARSLLATA